jgi:hypothetical protein
MQGKKKEAAQEKVYSLLEKINNKNKTIEILGREMINLPILIFIDMLFYA